MRYVIGIVAATTFLLWDMFAHDGQALLRIGREVHRIGGILSIF